LTLLLLPKTEHMRSKRNLVLGILAGAAVVSAAAFFVVRRRGNNATNDTGASSMPSPGERLAAKARHKAQHHFAQSVH
jgi:gas vesicle protein